MAAPSGPPDPPRSWRRDTRVASPSGARWRSTSRAGGVGVGVPGHAHLFHGVVAAPDTVAAVLGVPRLALAAEPGAATEEGLGAVVRREDPPDVVDRVLQDGVDLDDVVRLGLPVDRLAGCRIGHACLLRGPRHATLHGGQGVCGPGSTPPLTPALDQPLEGQISTPDAADVAATRGPWRGPLAWFVAQCRAVPHARSARRHESLGLGCRHRRRPGRHRPRRLTEPDEAGGGAPRGGRLPARDGRGAPRRRAAARGGGVDERGGRPPGP